jgi:hypothetical protein
MKIVKSLKLFVTAFAAIVSALTISVASEPIHLAALLDTNNLASAVAFLTLTGSKLEFMITSPECSTRVDIVTTTNGSLPGETIWTMQGGRENPHENPPGNSCPEAKERLPNIIGSEIFLTPIQVAQLVDDRGFMVFFKSSSIIASAQIVVLDSDGDGVRDSRDFCPDTPTGSLVNSDGCSIEQLSPCDADWKNRGEFLQRFQRVTAEFQAAGLISARQARELNRASAQSDCGK